MYILLDGHVGVGYNRAIGPFKSKLLANRYGDSIGGDPLVFELIHAADTENEEKVVGVVGTLVSGFAVFGVFNDFDEAKTYAASQSIGDFMCLPLVDSETAELEEATSNE